VTASVGHLHQNESRRHHAPNPFSASAWQQQQQPTPSTTTGSSTGITVSPSPHGLVSTSPGCAAMLPPTTTARSGTTSDGVKRYVDRCLQHYGGFPRAAEIKAAVLKQVELLLQNEVHSGTLHAVDWDARPILEMPPSLSTVTTQGGAAPQAASEPRYNFGSALPPINNDGFSIGTALPGRVSHHEEAPSYYGTGSGFYGSGSGAASTGRHSDNKNQGNGHYGPLANGKHADPRPRAIRVRANPANVNSTVWTAPILIMDHPNLTPCNLMEMKSLFPFPRTTSRL
jgi:hypothetical protein